MSLEETLRKAAKIGKIFLEEKDWPYTDPVDHEYLKPKYDSDTKTLTGPVLWRDSENKELGGTEAFTWDPLHNMDQSLKLAVDLKISIQFDYCTDDAPIVRCGRMNEPETWLTFQNFPHRYESTNMAIVCTAARLYNLEQEALSETPPLQYGQDIVTSRGF